MTDLEFIPIKVNAADAEFIAAQQADAEWLRSEIANRCNLPAELLIPPTAVSPQPPKAPAPTH